MIHIKDTFGVVIPKREGDLYFKASYPKKLENKYPNPIGILEKRVTNASKAKFYTNNIDIFLRYFDSREQYKALILAGNFGKIEEIIKSSKE